jgi:hypothetical protein
MSQTLMVFNKPTLVVATSQADIATGLSVECQVNSAHLTPAPSYATIPSTGCTGAQQVPGITAYALALAWLTDWTAGDETESLSRFAYAHDGEQVYVELTPNADDVTNSKMSGTFWCAAGGYGGTFGDGAAAATTASWPALGKPTIAPAPVTPLADADAAAAS